METPETILKRAVEKLQGGQNIEVLKAAIDEAYSAGYDEGREIGYEIGHEIGHEWSL